MKTESKNKKLKKFEIENGEFPVFAIILDKNKIAISRGCSFNKKVALEFSQWIIENFSETQELEDMAKEVTKKVGW